MPRFARRRSFWIVTTAFTLALVGGGAFYSQLGAQPTRTITQLAPGLTLLSVSTQTPNGPLRYWLVKAAPASWNLGLEVANAGDIFKKRSVRNLAAQSGATVAINGGFFAYGGAAVGAVKSGGEWYRLPWKSRTAMGWNSGAAQIGQVSGRCELSLKLADGTGRIENAALNGFALPGSHAPLIDGFAVLTRHFGAKWKRRSGEDVRAFVNGRLVPQPQSALAPEVLIPEKGFLLLARGTALVTLGQIQGASWKTRLLPTAPDRFPNLLGAGPRLVEKSVVRTTEVAEEFLPDVVARGPRTAVGWDRDKNWLFLVADGRQVSSVGLSLPETAQLFAQLGAVEAMNLDGGSSTQLVINGELINNPSAFDPVNPLRPREVMVSNALVLKTK
jgi:hypothetical protein